MRTQPHLTIFKDYLPQAFLNHHKNLQKLGIVLNVKTGHLFYSKNFEPLKLNFELVFIRHGETYGNCGQSTPEGVVDHDLVKTGQKNPEQRIFQGEVDTEINQLTALGKLQAEEAAFKLEETLLSNNWLPDIILYSPLTRAKDTAQPFITRNNFHGISLVHHGIKEMSFGQWDNRRVCDFRPTDTCHLFYRDQNALVKSLPQGESFCDVLERAYRTLLGLNASHPNTKIIMFSHSMFGAACCILLGKGQQIEKGEYLAFDGKRSNGMSYTMPHATPFHLNVPLPVNKPRAQLL